MQASAATCFFAGQSESRLVGRCSKQCGKWAAYPTKSFVFESLPGVLYASSAQSKAIQYRRKVSAAQISALEGYQSRNSKQGK